MVFDGVSYTTNKELADVYGINAKRFSERLRGGWPIEQALELESRPIGKTTKREVVIGGIKYPSLRAASDKLNIPFTSLLYNLNKNDGRYIPETGEPPFSINGNSLPFFYDGHIYPSLSAMFITCKDFNKEGTLRLLKNLSKYRAKRLLIKPNVDQMAQYAKVTKPMFIADVEAFFDEVNKVLDLNLILLDATDYLKPKLDAVGFCRLRYLTHHNIEIGPVAENESLNDPFI